MLAAVSFEHNTPIDVRHGDDNKCASNADKIRLNTWLDCGDKLELLAKENKPSGADEPDRRSDDDGCLSDAEGPHQYLEVDDDKGFDILTVRGVRKTSNAPRSDRGSDDDRTASIGEGNHQEIVLDVAASVDYLLNEDRSYVSDAHIEHKHSDNDGTASDAEESRQYAEFGDGESVDSWADWDGDDDGCGSEDDKYAGSAIDSSNEATTGPGEAKSDGDGYIGSASGDNDDGIDGPGGVNAWKSDGVTSEGEASAEQHVCGDATGWLGDTHRRLAEEWEATCIEGKNIKQPRFGRKDNRDYSPIKNIKVLLLYIFGFKHQLFRVAMSDLFSILRYHDGEEGDGAGEGRGFDFANIPSSGEHFMSRQRAYFPLLELWMRQVPLKNGKLGTASVYDIPINLILESLFMSPPVMKEMEANPGGVVLRGDEASKNCFMNDQVTAMATRPPNNARRSFMHGRIAASMPLCNSDAILTRGGTPVYMSDFVMAALREQGGEDPLQVPCRVLEVLFDVERQAVDMVVRCFHTATEVEGVEPNHSDFKKKGLVRVWEELGPRSEISLRDTRQLPDLREIVTPQEASDGKHHQPWSGGERREG